MLPRFELYAGTTAHLKDNGVEQHEHRVEPRLESLGVRRSPGEAALAAVSNEQNKQVTSASSG